MHSSFRHATVTAVICYDTLSMTNCIRHISICHATVTCHTAMTLYRVVQKADTQFIFAITSANEHRF